MFHRSTGWLICISVAAAIATNYSHPHSITDSSTMEAAKNVKQMAATDLGALLDAGDGAVVTLVASDARLAAHRAVLAARSPVFAAMFNADTPEPSSNHVTISDVEGPVLRQMLSYMYTLQVPQLTSMAPQLLAAAGKYELPTLKAECEQQVAAQLSTETAVATAVLAVGRSCTNSCTSLREAAVAFIKGNIFHVMATQGWADALHRQPTDLVKVIQLVSEPQGETSTPPPDTGDSGPTPTTELHSDIERTPATATPPTAPQTTPKAEDTALSLLRNVSVEEKGRLLVEAAKDVAMNNLQMLLALGADVEAKDEDRRTALHWAANVGHLEAVRQLLEASAEVDARDRWQGTPLHWAAWNGHAAVARLLLASSANPNARDEDGRTPLHDAVLRGHAEVVAALLEAGADLATQSNHRQLVDMLG